MTKLKSGNVVPGGRLSRRDAASGRFTLGRIAFGKVSEVEGIVVSRDLAGDLERLSAVSPERRRSVLARKYGKK